MKRYVYHFDRLSGFAELFGMRVGVDGRISGRFLPPFLVQRFGHGARRVHPYETLFVLPLPVPVRVPWQELPEEPQQDWNPDLIFSMPR
jgi:hypothetical protein